MNLASDGAISSRHGEPDTRVLGVIPARIGSERLPRKPLQRLAGRPLIEWVWRRVRGIEALDVVVATDSEDVAEVCRALGAAVELTDATHASGTDRVAEVAALPAYRTYDIIVNIQGDEPLIRADDIAAAVACVQAGFDAGTIAAPIGSLEAWRDPSVVKLVRGEDGRALYFSRAPIPHVRDGVPSDFDLASERYLRHIGVYAYSRPALERWVSLPPSPLEAAERLEQLRALAAGISIGVAVVDSAAPGVDTPEDLRRVESRLRESEDALRETINE